MSRWRNVRDNFMRFQRKRLRSGQAASAGRRYIYARQLDFLMGTRENMSTEDSSQAEEKDTDVANENLPAQSDEIPGPARADNPPRRTISAGPPRKRQIEDALMAFMQRRPEPITLPEDDDQAFFNSLLPMVREFTPDQKLELRMEVLNVIRRIRAMPIPTPSRPQTQNFAPQLTPFHPQTNALQTSVPYYLSYPSTSASQIPPRSSYTSTPQVSPLSPHPGEPVLSSSSQSQHSDLQYDFDLYSAH